MTRKTALQHYVILANPSPDSFGHTIARTYAETVKALGQEVDVCDLNAMAFDPVLRDEYRPGPHMRKLSPWVHAELDRIAQSAALIFVYPIWFGGPPAILKGYVDRVCGAAYDFWHFSAGFGQPALKGKRLLSITTSGTPLAWLQEHGQTLALREGFDVYLERGFAMRESVHLSIDKVIPGMSPAYAEEQLARVRDAARTLCDHVAQDAGTALSPVAAASSAN